MKVFAAGATGAIGHPLTEQLVRARHEVTGLTRSAEGADRLQQNDEKVPLAVVTTRGLQ